MWFGTTGVTIAMVCSSTIVLQRAYLASCRQRWILIVGVILILSQFSFAYAAFKFCVYTLETHGGCVTNYPPFVPWYWFGAVAPVNVLFSAIFSYVAYQQYQLFGSDAWKRLAKDGIQTMCLVIACNVFCGLALILEIGGNSPKCHFLMTGNWYA
jgi:hypothetical protein